MQHRKQSGFFIGIPLVVYILTVALSIFVAAVPELALFDVFLLAQAYAIFFYLANRLKTYSDLVFGIQTLAVTMLAQGILIVGLGGLGASAVGKKFSIGPMGLSVWPDGRVAGSLTSAVVAGSLIAILWLVVLPLNLTTRGQRTWVLTGLSLVFGLFGILLTQTRGALLTVGVGAIIIGVCMFQKRWLPFWAIALSLFMAIASAHPLAMMLQKRVVSGDDGSAESRMHLSLIALQTIKKQPIFGHGAGNCHLACLPVANSGAFRSEWYYTIHCKYLLVWVETGIIGLVAFLVGLGNSIRQGLVAWRQRHRYLSPLGLGCVAAIVGHMVHMLVDIFNSRSQVQTLWTILGITAAVYQLSLTSPSQLGRGGDSHVE